MNRRTFLKNGAALPAVFIPVVTYKTEEATKVVDPPPAPQSSEFYRDLVTDLRKTVTVVDNIVFGQPGLVVKGPRKNTELRILRGGAGYVLGPIAAKQVSDGELTLDTLNKEMSSQIRRRCVEYVLNKVSTLNATEVWMHPGCVIWEFDTSFELYVEVYIIFGVVVPVL